MEKAPHLERKLFLGGNWKSNGSVVFVKEIINEMVNGLEFDTDLMELVICPTTLHLALANGILDETKAQVCAQNVSLEGEGAFTGEVAAEHLKDFNIHWTLVGHSERRKLNGETNEVVAKKVARALSKKLNVVLCIGESLEDREAEKTNDVLAEQLAAVKETVSDWANVVIAYEPVWAIGTGKVATGDQAQDAAAFIRGWLNENVSEDVGKATRVIYGGSVFEKNCKDLILENDIDGFLVGGASLKPKFRQIVEVVDQFAKEGPPSTD